MSRAKVQVHPEGTPHPTEHTFEELLKRIVSVPRAEVDKHMAKERRLKTKRRERRSAK
jgi:hypothetical protein